MANHLLLPPFILPAEGGYVNNPNDKGGMTNKGITWTVWVSVFGDTHDRFMAMSSDDWSVIFKKLYWDKALADDIDSQRIANLIVDWLWGSGQYYPEKDTQEIVNTVLHGHIATDGVFGPATIAAINSANEEELYNDLIARRKDFIDNIVKTNPSQEEFHQGWINRLNKLVEYNLKFAPQSLN
jgi:lysozyme family protein